MKLRVKVTESGRQLETSAMVNTGFETGRLQLLIPKRAAEKLGIWPPPTEAEAIVLGTAGGPSRLYQLKDSLRVSLLLEEGEGREIICDALISDIEEEFLINDKLGEELGIVIERMGSGEWRLATDPTDRRRRSAKPELWGSS